MKKLINSPADFVDEYLEGILLAHPRALQAIGSPRVIGRAELPPGKVGIVSGGGSGHLPLFLGYVGRGLCSAVAIGNVFSSPSAQQVLDATRWADAGRGVLHLIGNYGGDVLNFGLAGRSAGQDGIEVATVTMTDDVLSAPSTAAKTRRGVGGLVLAYKCAGAAAERNDSLSDVRRIAEWVVESTRTVGVGLSPTILPAAGRPTFQLPEGQIEIGIGIHGEPGPFRGELKPVDDVADELIDILVQDLPLGGGEKVVVMVNGLGATPLEELYILYRRIHKTLKEKRIEIMRPFVGEYATSLEMAGASLTVLRLNDELLELIDAVADSPFFRR